MPFVLLVSAGRDWRRLAAVTAFGVVGMGPMGHVWYILLDKVAKRVARTNLQMVRENQQAYRLRVTDWGELHRNMHVCSLVPHLSLCSC